MTESPTPPPLLERFSAKIGVTPFNPYKIELCKSVTPVYDSGLGRNSSAQKVFNEMFDLDLKVVCVTEMVGMKLEGGVEENKHSDGLSCENFTDLENPSVNSTKIAGYDSSPNINSISTIAEIESSVKPLKKMCLDKEDSRRMEIDFMIRPVPKPPPKFGFGSDFEWIDEVLQACESGIAQLSIEPWVRLEVASLFMPPTFERSTHVTNASREETLRHSTQTTMVTYDDRQYQVDAFETPLMAQANRKKKCAALTCKKMDSLLKECTQEEKKDVLLPSSFSSRRRRTTENSVVKQVQGTRKFARWAEKSSRLMREIRNENPNFSKKDLLTNDSQDLKLKFKESLDGLDEISGVTHVSPSFNLVENSVNKVEHQVDSTEKQGITSSVEPMTTISGTKQKLNESQGENCRFEHLSYNLAALLLQLMNNGIGNGVHKNNTIKVIKSSEDVNGGSYIMELAENDKVFTNFVNYKYQEFDTDCDGKLSLKDPQPAVNDITAILGFLAHETFLKFDHNYSKVLNELTHGKQEKESKTQFKDSLLDTLLCIAAGLKQDPVAILQIDGDDLQKFINSFPFELVILSLLSEIDLQGRSLKDYIIKALENLAVDQVVPPAADPWALSNISEPALEPIEGPLHEQVSQEGSLVEIKRAAETVAMLLKEQPAIVAHSLNAFDRSGIRRLLSNKFKLKKMLDSALERVRNDRDGKFSEECTSLVLDNLGCFCWLTSIQRC
ncbi:Calcium-binding EF-hand family protein [Perilla frutescens var. hirtella]|uniref:Calcium-binding EF-hand family protein n=1 Tax=Perilla frutescens var. hirtella TaxID=608512 RepID=A0AAD4JLL8_PERFH|nr:Calcium-binding EF-hand family protein [Perilla frutescens var. hirtella]